MRLAPGADQRPRPRDRRDVHRGDARRQRAVGQRPADDEVDRVQAVPEDRNAERQHEAVERQDICDGGQPLPGRGDELQTAQRRDPERGGVYHPLDLLALLARGTPESREQRRDPEQRAGQERVPSGCAQRRRDLRRPRDAEGVVGAVPEWARLHRRHRRGDERAGDGEPQRRPPARGGQPPAREEQQDRADQGQAQRAEHRLQPGRAGPATEGARPRPGRDRGRVLPGGEGADDEDAGAAPDPAQRHRRPPRHERQAQARDRDEGQHVGDPRDRAGGAARRLQAVAAGQRREPARRPQPQRQTAGRGRGRPEPPRQPERAAGAHRARRRPTRRPGTVPPRPGRRSPARPPRAAPGRRTRSGYGRRRAPLMHERVPSRPDAPDGHGRPSVPEADGRLDRTWGVAEPGRARSPGAARHGGRSPAAGAPRA